jgi:RNA polymerase sigma-70 factor (ECF subfamily)
VSEPDLRAAYEDLLRRYVAALRRLAWSYVRDGGEDLFQEIAMALWTALPRFRNESSERTWVYRIAHNTAISFMSTGRRRAQREVVDEAPYEPASLASVEADLIERERRARMWGAVRALPILDRQIITMHLEGLSAAEVSSVTGVSAIAIATRLTRIRQRLITEIRGNEGDS